MRGTLPVHDARMSSGRYCGRASAAAPSTLYCSSTRSIWYPREVAEAWLKYLRQEHPTVAFKCSTQKQSANLSHRSTPRWSKKQKKGPRPDQDTPGIAQLGPAGALAGAECLGADTLLHLLKNYSRSGGLKTSITVGVVGLPNVGKSSLINSLKRARVAQVGNTPGVTRAVQEVHLDKHITLIDSPGIVFANPKDGDSAAAALRNCVKVEKLEDPQGPVAEIVRRCEAAVLMKIYKIGNFEGADDFLSAVAEVRGRLLRGGVPDRTAAARLVLQDWNNGAIPYYTVPPKREAAPVGAAKLVDAWGPDFDPEKVFANERSAVIEALPSLEDADRMFCLATSAGAVSLAGPGSEGLQAADGPSCVVEADGGEMEEERGEGEGEGGSDMSEGEGPALPGPGRPLSAVQTPALYDQEGQYNPHAARAERKRRKKLKVLGAPGVDLEDYDFNEGFAQCSDAEFEEDGEEEEGEEEQEGSEVEEEAGEGFDWDAAGEDVEDMSDGETGDPPGDDGE
eukprot:jgi/Botrbrau1/8089/Bobra.0230s0014.1